MGFTKSKADSNLYYKVEYGSPVILILYVDDIFVMMHYFLGMKVWKNADGIFIGQGKYAVDILKRFGMMESKAITTPMASNLKLLSDASLEVVDAMMYHQMIGSMMYLMNTRPNICFAMNTLVQFLIDLRHVHLIDAKHILRHLVNYQESSVWD